MLDLSAMAALVVIGVLVWRTDQFTAFLYPWGFLLLSVATALVLVAIVHQGSLLGAMFGCLPMRWIGERSYGIYLWQTPVIVFSQGLTGRHGWQLDLIDIAVTLGLSALSWTLIEDPIRRNGFRGTFAVKAQHPGVRDPHHLPIPVRQTPEVPPFPGGPAAPRQVVAMRLPRISSRTGAGSGRRDAMSS